MSAYTYTTEINPADLDAFVAASPMVSLLQSSAWAKVKDNWDHEYCAIYKDGQLAGTAVMLFKPVKAGYTMAYIPRGPVMDWSDRELVQTFIAHLKKTARKHKALFMKADPALVINEYASRDYNENRVPQLDEWMEIITSTGACHQGYTKEIRETIQPRFVSVVKQCEDVMAHMPRQTQKHVKLADRKGVTVTIGHKELLDPFARMVEKTARRKGISLRDRAYFEKLLDAYQQDCRILLAIINIPDQIAMAADSLEALKKKEAKLPDSERGRRQREECLKQMAAFESQLALYDSLTEKEKQGDIPIAGCLIVRFGPVCEQLYAGLDEKFRKFMPQYKEYAENFIWAFENGCTIASMGGVEGTLDDGLTSFKDNFNPVIQEYIGEFTWIVNPLLGPAALAMYNRMKQG